MTRSPNKYLCPVCLDLQVVKELEPGSALLTLACGHDRPFALLPSNGVSLEQLDEPIGKRLFPVVTFVASTAPTNADADADDDATEDEEVTHAE